MYEVPLSRGVRAHQRVIGKERREATRVHRPFLQANYRGFGPQQHQIRNFRARKERLLDLEQDAAQADSI